MATNIMDTANILRSTYDYPSNSIRSSNVAGSLVPDQYDSIALTYVAAGNGAGQIQTATYSHNGSQIATLTLTYDVQNRIINVART